MAVPRDGFAFPFGPVPTESVIVASCPLVVADIGGTNARFGWVEHPGAAVSHVMTLPTTEHSGPGQAMRHYLAGLPGACHDRVATSGLEAGWALASVVEGRDQVELTNHNWSFSRRAEAQALGLRRLVLLNDFEALAHALPVLQPSQWRSWDGRHPSRKGPMAVIGPGTGLGVAAMVPTAAGWTAVPGEGGHMTLAPVDDFESELLRCARKDWPHVSAERLLSGIGLPVLHRCVAQVRAEPVEELGTEAIVARGLAQEGTARHTLSVFCAMLGGHAGNVALTLGARGGVFIAGGLVPRLGEFFFRSGFRHRFEQKGRFSGYLVDIPTVLITDTLAALAGVAAAVQGAGGPPGSQAGFRAGEGSPWRP